MRALSKAMTIPMAADAKNIIQNELTANQSASNEVLCDNAGESKAITVLEEKNNKQRDS